MPSEMTPRKVKVPGHSVRKLRERVYALQDQVAGLKVNDSWMFCRTRAKGDGKAKWVLHAPSGKTQGYIRITSLQKATEFAKSGIEAVVARLDPKKRTIWVEAKQETETLYKPERDRRESQEQLLLRRVAKIAENVALTRKQLPRKSKTVSHEELAEIRGQLAVVEGALGDIHKRLMSSGVQ